MRRIIEQAVITLDGQISTPRDRLPTRWAGEFEQLSRSLLTSVDALLYGRVGYEYRHAPGRLRVTARFRGRRPNQWNAC